MGRHRRLLDQRVLEVVGGDSIDWLDFDFEPKKKRWLECGATSPTNRPKIERALAETKRALGVPEDRDWFSDYYQFCNRVAILHFLNKHAVPASLLYIYFTGDQGDRTEPVPLTKVDGRKRSGLRMSTSA